MDPTRCKAQVWDGGFRSYQCSRKAWDADGYCKQHHPDTVAERRRKSAEAYEAKKKTECWYQLKLAREEKDAEIERLKVEQAKYHELLYAVSKVTPGESRHETALRYICEREENAVIAGKEVNHE